jgi:multimeric flavodoxin WrbA
MIRIIGINGSPRKGKNTATMLEMALDAAQAEDEVETELIELSDYKILPCIGCNHCLRENRCSQEDEDEMAKLAKKLLEADGIILGSPVYLQTVSGQMKTFMDRTRWLKMTKTMLSGKVGGALAHAALRSGGQEMTNAVLISFMMSHGMVAVGPTEDQGAIFSLGAVGSMWESQEGEKVKWRRSVELDDVGVETSKALGRNVAKLAKRILGKAYSPRQI